jgi:hypothetical protein
VCDPAENGPAGAAVSGTAAPGDDPEAAFSDSPANAASQDTSTAAAPARRAASDALPGAAETAQPEERLTGDDTGSSTAASERSADASAAGDPAGVPVAELPPPVLEPVLRYDGDALVVARLVTALGEYGLEPRHLRQVKAAADREAALVEQIVAPLLHRRGAGAKSGAEETVRDLLSLTSRLHAVLVGSALKPLLDR